MGLSVRIIELYTGVILSVNIVSNGISEIIVFSLAVPSERRCCGIGWILHKGSFTGWGIVDTERVDVVGSIRNPVDERDDFSGSGIDEGVVPEA